MNIPGEPTGGSSLASWLRKLRAYCRASEVRPGPGYKVDRTSQGTVLKIDGIAGLPSFDAQFCDPDTGEVKTYKVYGYET